MSIVRFKKEHNVSEAQIKKGGERHLLISVHWKELTSITRQGYYTDVTEALAVSIIKDNSSPGNSRNL